MGLTREDVHKVAMLARLRLEDAELGTYTQQLNAILDFIEQLQEVDIEGVEPLAHGGEVTNVFREDRAEPSLPREKALANAPKRNSESFLVPAVLD